jgi:hypothetical protein
MSRQIRELEILILEYGRVKMRSDSFAGADVSDMVGAMSDWDEQQVETWHRLYEQVAGTLAQYGKIDSSGSADYWINEDNYGWKRISVGANNLKMLHPDIVSSLRELLSGLPGWEVTLAVDVLGKEKSWPKMGLTIRNHEIIDGLQRHLFPAEFQNFIYSDGKPGTGYD